MSKLKSTSIMPQTKYLCKSALKFKEKPVKKINWKRQYLRGNIRVTSWPFADILDLIKM